MNNGKLVGNEVLFKNRSHLMMIVIFNFTTWPLLIFDLILLLYHTTFYKPIIAFIIISLIMLFLDYYLIFYLGEYTPKRIVFRKNGVILDFISPFQKEKSIERRKITIIEVEKNRQMWPFKRYHIAIINPPNIHFLHDIPGKVIDHMNNNWKTEMNFEEKSWRFESFVKRMQRKYPELKR